MIADERALKETKCGVKLFWKQFVVELALATAIAVWVIPAKPKGLPRVAARFPASFHGAESSEAERARLQREASDVTITRDDWGTANISGKRDADAVFGMIYAQCEDDSNRVETNYQLDGTNG
jgi:acyl-homoserine lactone acylase PvdQ